jgi:hypothetical protein
MLAPTEYDVAPPEAPRPPPRSIADSPFGLAENQVVPIGLAWWYVLGVDASSTPATMVLAFKEWKAIVKALPRGPKARLAALRERGTR